jgi:5-methylcytosine-specific restriction protein A
MFEVGRVYNRRSEIHEPYGGQRYGGISTPRDRPFILLFTGESGEQYGYEDGWDDNGVFLYTGEGQKGDMEFIGGNRAIRDHALEGKDIYIFQALRRGGDYRYLGRFVCSTWQFRDGVDVNGNRRRVIVFHLIQPEDDEEGTESTSPIASQAMSDDLRERAFKAATEVRENPERSQTPLPREERRGAGIRPSPSSRDLRVLQTTGTISKAERNSLPRTSPYSKVIRWWTGSSPVGRCRVSQLPPGDAPRSRRRWEKQTIATAPERNRAGW